MDAGMVRVIRLALMVLGDRLLTILSLGMTFILALLALEDPKWEKVAVMAFFAIVVFIPTAIKERKKHEGSDQQD
jgi:hypothetical protein